MKPDLSNEYFTKVVPLLETIEVNSHYVDAKTVECERLNINGKKLETIINEEKLQPSDLIGRESIGEDDYYVLWDDNGQPIDVKLPEGYCPTFTNCSGLKTWKWDLSSVTDTRGMFQSCLNLESFEGDLSELINGTNMFCYDNKLSSFKTTNLDKLETGINMFFQNKITNFEYELPSLKNASAMFQNTLLASFEKDLPLLKNGGHMFFKCVNLTIFDGKLSLLESGLNMFMSCSSFKTFNSSLDSLIDGTGMFLSCKLSKSSIQTIINCLRTTNVLTTTATLDLGIDKTLATDSELLEFLQISEGVAQSITIVPPVRTLEDGTVVGGGTWTVNLTWN